MGKAIGWVTSRMSTIAFGINPVPWKAGQRPGFLPGAAFSRSSYSWPPGRGGELLDYEMFRTLSEAQVLIDQWRRHSDTARPHSTLGCRPPAPEVVVARPPGRSATRSRTGQCRPPSCYRRSSAAAQPPIADAQAVNQPSSLGALSSDNSEGCDILAADYRSCFGGDRSNPINAYPCPRTAMMVSPPPARPTFCRT